MVKWIVWLVLVLRQFPKQTYATRDTTIDVLPPSSAEVYTVNGNPFVNWTYRDYNKDGRVTFDVAARNSWESEWITQCNQTEKHSCDIVSPVFSSDKECKRYYGIYEAKVRACVHTQIGTTLCSSWIVKTFDKPSADQFTAPDFKIDGVYNGNQLHIYNHPFVLRHSNISNDCYKEWKLTYKILIWFENDKNHTLQDEYASFDMTKISLSLAFVPRPHTELCVQMSMNSTVIRVPHQWNTQCIQYPPNVLPPSSVEVFTVNGNLFINWTYRDYKEDGRVTFDVAARNSWENEWITQCNQTEKHSCDIVSPIFSFDTKCERHTGTYEAKVRACVHTQVGSTSCGSWIGKTFDIPLPSADYFTAPAFEIDGVYHGTQLRISNRPFVMRHSNVSVNCYYNRILAYKIFYWFGNDKNHTIQDEHVSFEMTTISLRLAFVPRQRTEICVRMSIMKEVKGIYYQGKTQCIQYTPIEGPDVTSRYAGLGVGIAAALLVLCVILWLLKLIRSKFFGEKFILPSDLNELMNDVSTGQEDIERQAITESAHMICFDLADEKYDCAAEIISTPDSVSIQPGSRKSLVFGTSFDFVELNPINHADSIPYIADAEAAAFLNDCDGNGNEIEKNELPRSGITDSNGYLTALRQEDKNCHVGSTSVPASPLSIEQLARARLCSSSMGDLASHQWDFTIAERRSLSTDNIIKSKLNEYCRTSEANKKDHEENAWGISTEKFTSKLPITAGEAMTSDAIATCPKDERTAAKVVCIENPTYNPNPRPFDFIDETFYCVSKSSENNHGMADVSVVSKRSNSVENYVSLHDRRVKSYGKRCHFNTREDHVQSTKFFIPKEGTMDDRLSRSQSNFGLVCPPSSSPKRLRVASDADSGYHVENFSVSDGSSLSPPVSPDEKLYPDVFPAGDSLHQCHRCSNDSAHSHSPMIQNIARSQQDNLIEPLYSTNSLKADGDSYEEESPYVTEGNLKNLCVIETPE